MLFDRAKQQCKIEGDMLFELNLIVNGGNGNLLNANLVDSLVITVVEMGCVVVRWRSWWFKDGSPISINVWSSFFFLFVVGDDLSLSFDGSKVRVFRGRVVMK